MKLLRILRIIREALIYVVFGTAIIMFLSYLIWMTSMVADCAR